MISSAPARPVIWYVPRSAATQALSDAEKGLVGRLWIKRDDQTSQLYGGKHWPFWAVALFITAASLAASV